MNTSFRVNNDIDFKIVEHYLRTLYNTADGQPCQYLLSSSFQKWLYNVRACLRQQKLSTTYNTNELIETYLPNYHLVFVNNEVSITFIKPIVTAKQEQDDTKHPTIGQIETSANGLHQPCAFKAKKQKIKYM